MNINVLRKLRQLYHINVKQLAAIIIELKLIDNLLI